MNLLPDDEGSRQYNSTTLKSNSTQKTSILIPTAVITSNLYFNKNRTRGHELDSTAWLRVKWQALMHTVLNHRTLQKANNLFIC
jgi:hypothetical protein